MTRQQLLDHNESLVRRYLDLDGNRPEEAEELRKQIAVTEVALMDGFDNPQPDPNLSCDQCGRPQWEDGSGLCSWRAGTEFGGCDGRQIRADK